MITIHTNVDSPNQIFAYKIPIEPYFDQMRPFEVTMPKDAIVLSAGFAGSEPAELRVWALIDTHQFVRDIRKFYVIGTGQGFPSPPDTQMIYVATAFTMLRREVFHVFEVIKDDA